jgi:molybdate transport system substrate-binding protein
VRPHPFVLSALIALLVVMDRGTALAAQPLVVFCAGAASAAVREIAHDVSRSQARTVVVKIGTVGQIRAQLAAGSPADVVIVSAPALAAIAKQGAIAGATRTVLGRTGIGVGIRAGAPVPDIATPEALKRALLAARTIASTDPAAGASSGIYFAGLLRRMGIAAAIAPKETLVSGGYSCEIVARGKADLCVQNISEIVPVKGVVLAGPFPPSLQNYITYSAAVLKHSRSFADARAFVADLSNARRAPLWRRAGFEPVSGH